MGGVSSRAPQICNFLEILDLVQKKKSDLETDANKEFKLFFQEADANKENRILFRGAQAMPGYPLTPLTPIHQIGVLNTILLQIGSTWVGKRS